MDKRVVARYCILLAVCIVVGYELVDIEQYKESHTSEVHHHIKSSGTPDLHPIRLADADAVDIPFLYVPLRECGDGPRAVDNGTAIKVVSSDIVAYSTELLRRTNWVKRLGEENGTEFASLLDELAECQYDHIAAANESFDELHLPCEDVTIPLPIGNQQPKSFSLPIFWTESVESHSASAFRSVENRRFTYKWFDPASVFLQVQPSAAVQERLSTAKSSSYTISWSMKWKNDNLEKNSPGQLRVIAAGSIPEYIVGNGSFLIGCHRSPSRDSTAYIYLSVYALVQNKLYICSAETDVFNNEYIYHISVSFGYDLKGRFTVPNDSEFEIHLYVNGIIESIVNERLVAYLDLPPIMEPLRDMDGNPFNPDDLKSPGFLSIGGVERDYCLYLRRYLVRVKSGNPRVFDACHIRACLPYTGNIFDVRLYDHGVSMRSQWMEYEKDCEQMQNGECLTVNEVTALEPYYFTRPPKMINPDLYWPGHRYADKLPGDAPKLLNARFPARLNHTSLTGLPGDGAVYANEDVEFGIVQRDGRNRTLTMTSDSVYRVRFEGPALFRGTVAADTEDPSLLWIRAKFPLPGVYQMYAIKQDIGECNVYGLEDLNSNNTAYDTYCGDRESAIPGVPAIIRVLPARHVDAEYNRLLAYLQSPEKSEFPICTDMNSAGFWVPAKINKDDEIVVDVSHIATEEEVRTGSPQHMERGPQGEWKARWQPWKCRYLSFSKARIDRCAAAPSIRRAYGLPEVNDVSDVRKTPVHKRPWVATIGDSTTMYMYREYNIRSLTGKTEYFSPTKCSLGSSHVEMFNTTVALPACLASGETLSAWNKPEQLLYKLQHPYGAVEVLQNSIRAEHGNISDTEVEEYLLSRKPPLFVLVNFGLHDIRSTSDRRKLVVPATKRLLDGIRKIWPDVLLIFRDFYQLQYNFCLRNAYNQRTLRKMWETIVRAYGMESINAYEMTDPRCDSSVDAVHYDACAHRQSHHKLSGSVSKQVMDIALTRVCGHT